MKCKQGNIVTGVKDKSQNVVKTQTRVGKTPLSGYTLLSQYGKVFLLVCSVFIIQ